LSPVNLNTRVVDSLILLEDNIAFLVIRREKCNTLGIGEHGMLLKFTSELGRSLLFFCNEVLTNKCKNEKVKKIMRKSDLA